ncbi:AAA family ATPase [Pseudomonas syringae]|uniref:AAA family ATPase n=1 Tax=Pseudomonas syringae TaxID=317 RepID=UPI001F0D8004|nr:AAA family ATPase [Pseudomonas syringae]MCH5655460.1 AAA family ATPase [Pseudomonas syringae]
MRLTQIEITKLFGIFDHIIPLSHDGNVTIIHGANGVGKTVLLKMVASLIDGRITIFEKVPFRQFKATREDGRTIVITKKVNNKGGSDRINSKIEISMVNSKGEPLECDSISSEEISSDFLDSIDHLVPSPYHRKLGGWTNGGGRKVFSLNEIIELFPYVSKHLPESFNVNVFSAFTTNMEIFFVETKRLYAEQEQSDHNPFNTFDDDRPKGDDLRVHQYSADIVTRIKTALADYAKHSQERDRTFPARLVKFVRDEENSLSEKSILASMSEIELKRQRLVALGFLDSETELRDISEEDVRRSAAALTIYVDDIKQKLNVFDVLSDRVGRLMDIVNARFKYKRLTLNRNEGFRFKALNGAPIDISDLSSGEQHELVLLYELLFRVPKNGLVLVDEPEISLHVAWQASFLEDLMGILKLTESYGIVATHSPVLIGNHWDLTKELFGPSVEEVMGQK